MQLRLYRLYFSNLVEDGGRAEGPVETALQKTQKAVYTVERCSQSKFLQELSLCRYLDEAGFRRPMCEPEDVDRCDAAGVMQETR